MAHFTLLNTDKRMVLGENVRRKHTHHKNRECKYQNSTHVSLSPILNLYEQNLLVAVNVNNSVNVKVISHNIYKGIFVISIRTNDSIMAEHAIIHW
ncbi:hypothetical protein BMS3Bbin04_01302 [bacterium BMS3Bbin04]|nr:hypothetical protein BMS3Bbin04_01302 [bacterium BMS3Bbin04]